MGCDVLCTAENFGFGPAAALHQLVAHFNACGLTPDYAGSGITLDLHGTRYYREVHDADVRRLAGRRVWHRLVQAKRRVVSVCDIDAAEVACAAGADVVLYDILAWFRRPLPPVYNSVGLLLCPDFFGLRERLDEAGCENARVMPALMPPREVASPSHARRVLINMGGLHTPYTSDVQCAAYAQLAVDAVCAATGEASPTVLISKKIGALLRNCDVRTVTPAEARLWLASTKMAFMTSGLGNIVDAAGQNACVCFLPPMSDTQGLQANALSERGLVPMAIDWHQLTNDPAIDYTAAKSETVPAMVRAVERVIEDADAQARFVERLRTFAARVDQGKVVPILQREFQQRFGSEDGRRTAAAVAAHFRASA